VREEGQGTERGGAVVEVRRRLVSIDSVNSMLSSSSSSLVVRRRPDHAPGPPKAPLSPALGHRQGAASLPCESHQTQLPPPQRRRWRCGVPTCQMTISFGVASYAARTAHWQSVLLTPRFRLWPPTMARLTRSVTMTTNHPQYDQWL